jgi:beta-lactamase class A
MKLPRLRVHVGKNQTLTLVALGSFVGGALLAGGAVAFYQSTHPAPKARALRESDIATNQSDYKFIDPLIAIRGAGTPDKYDAMQKQIAAYISDQKKNALVTATVNFGDINEPGGFTLNPSEMYTPASLNKVPVMMAYYKISETKPTILTDEILYPGTSNHNDVEEIKSPVQLTPGATYSVEQLIEHMIRYSDNNAADLLTAHLKDTNNVLAYGAVFSDLGIDPRSLTQYTDTVTAQQYMLFLRSLYNATYLDRADSEKALQLLSDTDFSEGIESGIPNDVTVAQKFGEVRMTDASGAFLGKEINNCGIVYYPGHPYQLCIMTKATGDDVKTLEGQIASISRIVYKNMQTLYP